LQRVTCVPGPENGPYGWTKLYRWLLLAQWLKWRSYHANIDNRPALWHFDLKG
jgi:hypothetical protein